MQPMQGQRYISAGRSGTACSTRSLGARRLRFLYSLQHKRIGDFGESIRKQGGRMSGFTTRRDDRCEVHTSSARKVSLFGGCSSACAHARIERVTSAQPLCCTVARGSLADHARVLHGPLGLRRCSRSRDCCRPKRLARRSTQDSPPRYPTCRPETCRTLASAPMVPETSRFSAWCRPSRDS